MIVNSERKRKVLTKTVKIITLLNTSHLRSERTIIKIISIKEILHYT